jgi:hypothetical protein
MRAWLICLLAGSALVATAVFVGCGDKTEPVHPLCNDWCESIINAMDDADESFTLTNEDTGQAEQECLPECTDSFDGADDMGDAEDCIECIVDEVGGNADFDDIYEALYDECADDCDEGVWDDFWAEFMEDFGEHFSDGDPDSSDADSDMDVDSDADGDTDADSDADGDCQTGDVEDCYLTYNDCLNECADTDCYTDCFDDYCLCLDDLNCPIEDYGCEV